jgi:two-component system CheB/CheR fusion protein
MKVQNKASVPVNGRGKKQAKEEKLLVVAIGASAGGLKALQGIFGTIMSLPQDVCFIIAHHLSPRYKSKLAELLSTKYLQVSMAADGDVLQAGKVYVTPPGRNITVSKGAIRLKSADTLYKPSIDLLFRCVATEYRGKAVGIVLSGTGEDGAAGVKAIRENGGFTVVEMPQETECDGMPLAAIATGCVDIEARTSEMMAIVEHYALHGAGSRQAVPESQMAEVLKRVKAKCGTDFSQYKSTTVGRRVQRRVSLLGLGSLEDYLKHTTENPAELEALHRDLMIGVTAFFRDKHAFRFLQNKLAAHLRQKEEGETIRIWVPGCATGEEVYTLAMALYEIMGERITRHKVQIFGSDINDQALQAARRGIYNAEALKKLDKKLRDKYMEPAEDSSFAVGKKLRSIVLFSRHDVIATPPFARIDLVSCRNLFIYFGRELQNRVLRYFHYALNSNGLLFLGKSENIDKNNPWFAPVSNTHRLYARKDGDVTKTASSSSALDTFAAIATFRAPVENPLDHMLRNHFLEQYPWPFAVVDEQMHIKSVSRNISPYVALAAGEFSRSIIKNTHPSLQIELRAVLQKSIKENKKITGQAVHVSIGKSSHCLRLTAEPVLSKSRISRFFIVSFMQEPSAQGERQARVKPLSAREERKTAELEQELLRTREHLQAFVEELESGNEELQSLNEELQSANEELQATNEELETSNEELQSASQEMVVTFNELQEVYRLLEKKEEEISATANRLQAILENSSQGYLLVNAHYRIISFNHEADAIIRKLTGSPVVQDSSVFNCAPLQTLDSFKKNLDRAFAGETVEYEAEERCGSGTVWLRFRYVPVYGAAGKIETALISYIDLSGEITARKLIEVKEANLNSVVENFDGYVWSMDRERRYITFNSLLKNEIKKIYGVEVRPGDKVQGLLETLDPRRSGEWEKLYDAAFEGKPRRLVHEFNTNGRQSYFELSLNPISDGKGVLGLSCFARDITGQVTRKNQLDAMERRYRSLIENSLDGISLLDSDGKFSYLTPSVKRILGYEPAELEGQSPSPYIHPEDMEKFASMVQEISGKQGQSTNANFRALHKNGGWKWLNCNITNMLHQPAVKAIVFNYKDISERVAAEEKLLSSHEKLVASQMLAKVGSWEFALDGLNDLENTPVEWSDGAYHIFGCQPGQVEITSGFFFGMVNPEDRVKIREAVMECINGGKPSDVEYRIELKDGTTRFIYARMRIIYSSTGKPLRISGVCQDITERKLNEIKIIQSEANLRGILDNSNTAFQLFDTSFNIVAFNQLAYEWTLAENGKKLEPGRNFSYYIKEEHHDYFRKFYQDALDGQDVCFEYTGRSTGRNYYINIKRITGGDGRAHGICISTIDLTEQKRAERAIMDSEMLYRSLFNNSPLPKWVCDKKTLRFLEVNDTAVTQYGYSREEFLGMTAYDLRAEEEHGILDQVIEKGSQVVKNRLATHRRKNGTIIFATVSVHELHYKGVDAYLVLANDVTETLKLQKELSEEKLNKQIEINRTVLYVQEQERMELGRELHDNVNQMLTSVKLYMDTALADNTHSRDFIDKGRAQVMKCIEELRRISKSLVPPSLGDLSLGEALEEIVLPLRLTGKSVKLDMSTLREDVLKDDLKISIYRIVQEQLNNIVKYAEASRVRILIRQDSSSIELQVTDNGKGFDLTARRKGIGINNIINRVNAFHGNILIEAAPGKGCSLNVSFQV